MTGAPSIHLLWITENYPPSLGGMSVSCDRIIRGLRAQGAMVEVLHLSPRHKKWQQAKQQGGRLWCCPVSEDASHTLNVLYESLSIDSSRKRFTHVVAFGGHLPILAGPIFAAWLGLPLITLLRGNDFDSAIFSAQRSGPLRECLQASKCICTVSRDKQERVLNLYPKTKTVNIPNGIDLKVWEALPSDQNAAKEWRTSQSLHEKRVIGLFGEIKPKKGGLHLLHSLQAAGLSSQIHLLWVGSVEASIEQSLTLESPQLSYNLFPFEDRYAIMRHYCACDAIAIPSFYDGMPNVLLEAMALGIPLIASTAGGMGDVLVDGVHGFLFAPGDLLGCRQALERFAQASDRELFVMGQACQLRVQEFPHEQETRGYLEIFQSTRMTSEFKEAIHENI